MVVLSDDVVVTAEVLSIGVLCGVVVPLIVDEADVAMHVEDMLTFNVTMYPSTVPLISSK